MKWLVSGEAYAQVQSERDWLRAELEKTRDHLRRMERAKAKLPEIAPQARKQIPPMPQSLQDKISQWGSDEIRKDLTTRAWNLARSGRPWAEVEDKIDRIMAPQEGEVE